MCKQPNKESIYTKSIFFMANVIKLKRGLTVNLAGKPSSEVTEPKASKVYGIVPDAFVGVKPKVVVKEGETVCMWTSCIRK